MQGFDFPQWLTARPPEEEDEVPMPPLPPDAYDLNPFANVINRTSALNWLGVPFGGGGPESIERIQLERALRARENEDRMMSQERALRGTPVPPRYHPDRGPQPPASGSTSPAYANDGDYIRTGEYDPELLAWAQENKLGKDWAELHRSPYGEFTYPRYGGSRPDGSIFRFTEPINRTAERRQFWGGWGGADQTARSNEWYASMRNLEARKKKPGNDEVER